jgi:transcriptional regulator with XRE-family HTH domain
MSFSTEPGTVAGYRGKGVGHVILLRRVIGDALRARRQAQHRTLREVSTAANVSLGYLSEIERGQKEASSELLAAVCDALGARLSEVLREVSSTVATTEQREGLAAAPVEESAAVPEQREHETPREHEAPRQHEAPREHQAPAPAPAAAEHAAATVSTLVEGDVAVTVRHDGPLSARLTARTIRRDILTGV